MRNQDEFPIEKVAMKDYIFDTGKEYHNGAPFFKASFLVDSCDSLAQIKKQENVMDMLKKKKIFIQEYNSTEVYDSTEVGFLCNLHPSMSARKHIVHEFKEYIRQTTGVVSQMKLKLTNRFFGGYKEGTIKSQYLALYVETANHKLVARAIGHGLESGKLLKKWKTARLLPTKPTLHECYDKSKFAQVLQIHNKSIRETSRVTIKNMWVGDYVLPENKELFSALGVSPGKFTLRKLLFEAAEAQKLEIKDFTVTGSRAHVICARSKFTKISDFVDVFLDTCKKGYGDIFFC